MKKLLVWMTMLAMVVTFIPTLSFAADVEKDEVAANVQKLIDYIEENGESLDDEEEAFPMMKAKVVTIHGGQKTIQISFMKDFHKLSFIYESEDDGMMTMLWLDSETGKIDGKIDMAKKENGEYVYYKADMDQSSYTLNTVLKFSDEEGNILEDEAKANYYSSVVAVGMSYFDSILTEMVKPSLTLHMIGFDSFLSDYEIYGCTEDENYTYTGKTIAPGLILIDANGKRLTADVDYIATYPKSSKNVGAYTIKVEALGEFEGVYNFTYKINPKGTSLKYVKRGNKSFTVKWKKQSSKMAKSRITGYQIQYARNSKFTSAKTRTLKGYSRTSTKVKKQKAKTKYYVRVRTYTKTGGKTYYSSWSKAKSVKTR